MAHLLLFITYKCVKHLHFYFLKVFYLYFSYFRNLFTLGSFFPLCAVGYLLKIDEICN
jgi:hypothetical protein